MKILAIILAMCSSAYGMDISQIYGDWEADVERTMIQVAATGVSELELKSIKKTLDESHTCLHITEREFSSTSTIKIVKDRYYLIEVKENFAVLALRNDEESFSTRRTRVFIVDGGIQIRGENSPVGVTFKRIVGK